MFINISNHNSSKWSSEQLEAAKNIGNGEVIDIAFPNVPSQATTQEVTDIARKVVCDIDNIARGNGRSKHEVHIVHVMGESTLVFSIVHLLQRYHYIVVASTTERISEERVENGSTVKNTVFKFVQFRQYESY